MGNKVQRSIYDDPSIRPPRNYYAGKYSKLVYTTVRTIRCARRNHAEWKILSERRAYMERQKRCGTFVDTRGWFAKLFDIPPRYKPLRGLGH